MINSSGDYFSTGNHVSFSIGESVIAHYQVGGDQVTSGFLQPRLVVEPILGISDKTDLLQVTVFPNPTTHFLKIQIPQEERVREDISAKIYSQDGKLIKSATLNPTQHEHQVDFSKLPEGIYIMMLTTFNSVRSFKIKKN